MSYINVRYSLTCLLTYLLTYLWDNLCFLLTYLLSGCCRCAAGRWMLSAGVVDGQDDETRSTATSTSIISVRVTSTRAHLPVESAQLRTTTKHRRQRQPARRRPPCRPVPQQSSRMEPRSSATPPHPHRTSSSQVPATTGTTSEPTTTALTKR